MVITTWKNYSWSNWNSDKLHSQSFSNICFYFILYHFSIPSYCNFVHSFIFRLIQQLAYSGKPALSKGSQVADRSNVECYHRVRILNHTFRNHMWYSKKPPSKFPHSAHRTTDRIGYVFRNSQHRCLLSIRYSYSGISIYTCRLENLVSRASIQKTPWHLPLVSLALVSH